MKRIAFASFVAALVAAGPAGAVTNENGQVLITQTAVNAGSITPGDTPGFPVTISQPGSYRLASNLAVTTSANGIEVRANDVSIDMGGFTLAGSGVGRNGIAIFNRTLRVTNGNVRGFTNDGIRSIAPYLTVDNMIVSSNGRVGIYADRGPIGGRNDVAYASFSANKVTYNGSSGIICGDVCRVENSMVASNSGTGISFNGVDGFALGNTVTRNSNTGILFESNGGFGNNVVAGNTPQVSGGTAMFPNACQTACPPPSTP